MYFMRPCFLSDTSGTHRWRTTVPGPLLALSPEEGRDSSAVWEARWSKAREITAQRLRDQGLR
jgi:hypothetical protein